MIGGDRRMLTKRSRETRYYIICVENRASLILEAVRAHGASRSANFTCGLKEGIISAPETQCRS